MNGSFPRSTELLLAVFADAVARAGSMCVMLELDEPCNERSDAQWRAFAEHHDSVAFVSWCVDKLRHWHTPAYLARQVQPPVLGDVPSLPFVITSPDGATDWTLAAFHMHAYTTAKSKSPKPFTEHFMRDIESTPAVVSVADLARQMSEALGFQN